MKRIVAALVVGFAFAVAAGAQAQTYPDKPIRLVVPFPAGSRTDIIGRLLGQQMSLDLGQPVIVDNRPGASTIVGTDIVAKSAPDGYTMVMASNNHAMNPSLFEGKLPFDSIKDFAAVGEVAVLPFILVVNPKLPAKTLPELIALAKKGGLTYASTGNGTPPHVAGEMLKRAAKLDITHIPYKGSAAAVQDVVSGQVSMMFVNVPSGMSLVQAGKLRVLAVGSARRLASMPDVPTVAELGFPGFDVSLWMGLLMPAGTPADVIDRMSREVEHALADPALRKKIEEQGAEPAYTPPAVFSKFIVDETKRFDDLVKEVGLRVD
ncbi:MAG: tripartite tricarboxylate transporter substrate binding protein [Reyranellales bacterium]